MLANFTFNNFKCFKNQTNLNCLAIGSHKNDNHSQKTPFKYSLLKTVAVYGANASGKTKLFEAFKFMRCVVCPPKRENKIPVFDYWQTKYDPFRLDTQSLSNNSFFEVIFVLNNIQYRYGFELNADRIEHEWLFQKQQREISVLTRDENLKVYINKNCINDKIADNIISASMLSKTVPIISILSTFNEPLCKLIVNWFESIEVISANDIKSIPELSDSDKANTVVKFLKAFDFNIESLSLHEISIDEIPDKIKSILNVRDGKGKFYDGVQVKHNVYNDLYERASEVNFKLEVDESFGTNRLFHLSWPIISALKNGKTLFIDEIDSGIHPNIIQSIISLFYKYSDAQLIFNTQNTSLLSANEEDGTHNLLMKDQVYVTNKNRYGESKIKPISELSTDLRSNREKTYLSGDISGVPYINISAIFEAMEN